MTNSHGTIGLPADGAGKKLHTVQFDDNGNQFHNQVYSVGDAENPEQIQKVDAYGSAYIRFANGGFDFDSFGNAKVSQVTPVGIYMPRHGKLSDKFQETINGTASSVHDANESLIKVQVGSSASDSFTRTSNKYHYYTPGIANTVLMTLSCGDSGKNGLTRRWGYFDEKDGIYFEQKDGVFNVVLRSSISGTVVERRIPQSTFNNDKIDGTGISKVTIDLTNSNIFWIDFQWLGVGIVRMGVYNTNGKKITIHEFYNANSMPSMYMRTGALPIRYEMFNDAITAGVSDMRLMNAVVMVNNISLEFNTKPQTMLLTEVIIESPQVYETVAVFRPKQNDNNGFHNHGAIIPRQLKYDSTKSIKIALIKNPTYLDFGTGTWSDALGNNPLCEYSTDINVDTSNFTSMGEWLYSDVVSGAGSINLGEKFSYYQENLYNLADRTIPDGTVGDTYALVVRTIRTGETDTIYSALGWEDLHV